MAAARKARCQRAPVTPSRTETWPAARRTPLGLVAHQAGELRGGGAHGPGLLPLAEKARDGMVGRGAVLVHAAGQGQLAVDAFAVAVLGVVAGRRLQARGQAALQVHAGGQVRQLRGPGRVLQVLHGLDAGDVREEPAAAGVHEHGVPLHLQQAQGLDPVLRACPPP